MYMYFQKYISPTLMIRRKMPINLWLFIRIYLLPLSNIIQQFMHDGEKSYIHVDTQNVALKIKIFSAFFLLHETDFLVKSQNLHLKRKSKKTNNFIYTLWRRCTSNSISSNITTF